MIFFKIDNIRDQVFQYIYNRIENIEFCYRIVRGLSKKILY